jgi:hypothetical protein
MVGKDLPTERFAWHTTWLVQVTHTSIRSSSCAIQIRAEATGTRSRVTVLRLHFEDSLGGKEDTRPRNLG